MGRPSGGEAGTGEADRKGEAPRDLENDMLERLLEI